MRDRRASEVTGLEAPAGVTSHDATTDCNEVRNLEKNAPQPSSDYASTLPIGDESRPPRPSQQLKKLTTRLGSFTTPKYKPQRKQ